MTVCVCVLMNHPFPDNIPLIRRLYAGRFDKLLFMIPFHRSEDEDVITVYRGSYVHASYITDSRDKLLAVDCDHYLFIHDDVILNPAIDDANFYETFPLGAADGFFPSVGGLPAHIGGWSWFPGFMARMLFPKSLVFGSGVETAVLDRYLPSSELILEKFEAVGIAPPTGTWINTDWFDAIRHMPARVLFNGLAGEMPASPEQRQVIESKSLNVAERLVEVMADVISASRERGPDHPDGEWVPFTRPMVTGGYLADCYIVPKTRLPDYAHAVGVASAAHMLTEMMAPTLLYAVCDRVLSAKDCGLDLDGFGRNVDLELFYEKRIMALHPYKMSSLKDPTHAERFFRRIDWIRLGQAATFEATPGVHSLGGLDATPPFAIRGWGYPEGWGCWAAGERAFIRFWAPKESRLTRVRVRLYFPLHPAIPTFDASLSLNGGTPVLIRKTPADPQWQDVELDGADIRLDSLNEIEVVTDVMHPCDVDPENTDGRAIGVGVMEIEFA